MRKELRALIEERNLQQLKALLTHMPVEQIVEILRELRLEEQVVLFRLLSKDKALETYETLTRNEQIALVQAMENPDILSLLLEMDTDEQAELLEELPAKVVNQVLQQLSPEARRQVNLLLGFPEGSVGRIMEPSYLARPLHATAGATLDWVRHSPLDPENLEEILVVGEGRLYKGYVTLSRLLKAHPETRLEQLLEGQDVYVSAYAPESEAAKLFLRHKLPLLPVVDRDGRLVGVVQTRRAFELLEEQETRQLVRFGGTLAVSPAGGPDLDVLGDPLKRLFLGRFVWLAILTFFGVFTSTFVAKQEEMLAQVIVLAAFIAPIIDMGGNTGSQTATLVIRAMALGQLRSAWRDFLRVVKRDVPVAIGLGVTIALLEAILAYLSKGVGMTVLLIVGLSMLTVTALGSLIGIALPFVARRLGADPATLSSPVITSIMDLLGVMVYFGYAYLFLKPF